MKGIGRKCKIETGQGAFGEDLRQSRISAAPGNPFQDRRDQAHVGDMISSLLSFDEANHVYYFCFCIRAIGGLTGDKIGCRDIITVYS